MKIMVDLDGEVLDRFENYKKRENLKANSATVYKIVADHLQLIEEKNKPQESHTRALSATDN